MENADSENGVKEEIDGMMDMKNTNDNIINQCSNQQMCNRMWINRHWCLVHRQCQFGSVNSVIWSIKMDRFFYPHHYPVLTSFLLGGPPLL